MSHATNRLSGLKTETLPQELMELRERVLAQAGPVRAELEPLIEEALECGFRETGRLRRKRGALQQFKLDLELTRFDLDVTRRERAELLRMLGDRDEDD